jgi:hypothetical protein
MPKNAQFQKTNQKLETLPFVIVWDLAFGVWPFAPALKQADSRPKQREAGAC